VSGRRPSAGLADRLVSGRRPSAGLADADALGRSAPVTLASAGAGRLSCLRPPCLRPGLADHPGPTLPTPQGRFAWVARPD